MEKAHQHCRWRPTLGAIIAGGGTTFRVWTPRPERVELVLHLPEGDRIVPMAREGQYAVAEIAGVGAGARYRYRLDGEGPFPDPCSRSQPEGVHGPSEVVDPASFTWTDGDWQPPDPADLVIYECHIGTLTPEGTFDAAIGQLGRLRDLGVTAIELMPVSACPGRWNWGYDGVAHFAPFAPYGGPEGLRRLVDAAHQAGLAVLLDVVYNHFGPDGNYTGLYSERYLTNQHHTPWGAALNYDDVDAAEVRRFIVENLLHFVHEHHIDGYRLDATFAIVDASERHVLGEIADTLQECRRGARRAYLFAETYENDGRYLLPTAEGGYGFDGVWADEFHHVARTILQPERQGYLSYFDGTADELARTIAGGFLHEGTEGTADIPPNPQALAARDRPWHQFVYCIQNHDQVGNRAFGQRLNVTAAHSDFTALSFLLLLLPQTPLLFQGQEFLASTPFLFFTDHNEALGKLVTEGRRREFAAFVQFSDPALRDHIPDPQDPRTFRRSQLNLDEAAYGAGLVMQDLYRAVLRQRATDPVLIAARRGRPPLRAEARERAVLVEIATAAGTRLIAANFGPDVVFPYAGAERLATILHTGEPRFGGNAVQPGLVGGEIALPAHGAALFTVASAET